LLARQLDRQHLTRQPDRPEIQWERIRLRYLALDGQPTLKRRHFLRGAQMPAEFLEWLDATIVILCMQARRGYYTGQKRRPSNIASNGLVHRKYP
jgi:hypothetical protein